MNPVTNPVSDHATNPAIGNPVVTEPALRELGRTAGGPDVLARLVAGQRTRRLLILRALLDAVAAAPPALLPPAAAARLRDHWALLEAADHADPETTREVLHYPLVGPWAERCLRTLAAATGQDAGTGTAPGSRELVRDLAHLGAVAAVAAARSGISFTAYLPAREGTIVLPTLGALRCGAPGATIAMTAPGDRLTVAPDRGRPFAVSRRSYGAWRSADPRWKPLLVLGGAARPVPLDDLDPFRTAGSGMERHGLRSAGTLDPDERHSWTEAWRDALPLLQLGDGRRAAELDALLTCMVPLARPPGASPHGGVAHCSGTRREAFGAVLSSTPQRPAYLAATLVHELQHAKLSALAHLVPLHTADDQARYWAPWRPDPRPFDGLLQGTYSHLALAEYWQLAAVSVKDPLEQDYAWAEHARCREQVGAVLPALAGSQGLTGPGRIFVQEMTVHHARLKRVCPPGGHLSRAAAYVDTARSVWRRRFA